MSTTNLILRIEGNISLEKYARAIAYFKTLVNELGLAVAGQLSLPWEISGLAYGSAEIIVDISDDTPDVLEQAAQVVRAYEEVSQSLEEGMDIPYTQEVGKAARSLSNLIDGGITSMIFATINRRVRVDSPATANILQPRAQWAWGSIRGEVGSISKRPRKQITVYDSVFDRAVNCYLREPLQEDIAALWKSAKIEVVGKVHYSGNGRPIKVTHVVDVRPLSGPDALVLARNARPWTNSEMPEVIIRRLRNDE